MCLWFKKIPWPKVWAAGLIYTVVAIIIRQAEAFVTLNYYMMPQYFGVWSKVMMPTAGPPPASFYILSFLFTLLTGVALAVVYEFVKDLLPKKFWQRVCVFAKTTVALMLLFSILPMYLMINIPLGLLISWTISGSLILLTGAIIFAKFLR